MNKPETQSAVSNTQPVRRLVENHPQLSPRERHNINQALDAGAAHGYGNVISWLMTEWAVILRDKWGIKEQYAIRATQMWPHPLPPADQDRQKRKPRTSPKSRKIIK